MPAPSRPFPRAVERFTWRIAGVSFAAVLVYGCSAPQPIPLKEAPLPAIAVVSAPPAENVSPVFAVVQAIIPVADEDNVFFALRSATIDDVQKEKLRRHADRLKANRKERVLLVGHSDNQGSRNYNLAITEERVMAVQRLLRSYGVPARQIRRNRSAKLRVACAACQQQTRRVELVYLP